MGLRKHFNKVNKILKDEEFQLLYGKWKNNKCKGTYKDLVAYLSKKSKRETLFMTDDENKLVFNSNTKNSFKEYIDGNIKFSDPLMQYVADKCKTENSCSIESKILTGGRRMKKYSYACQKFGSAMGSGAAVCYTCSGGEPGVCDDPTQYPC